MSEMVEVVIDSIRVHLMAPNRVVVLKQGDGERFLTIWVGPYEAEAITVALQEVEMLRPLTHDLIRNIFGAFQASLVRVEIVSVQDNIFYGSIVAEFDGREIQIDSRSSDAIALAVRAHIPIYVHKKVMDEAGIVPEADMQDTLSAPFRPETSALLSEEPNDRLSVFKDFLDKMDLDDPGQEPPASNSS